jgi:hypothetical protein
MEKEKEKLFLLIYFFFIYIYNSFNRRGRDGTWDYGIWGNRGNRMGVGGGGVVYRNMKIALAQSHSPK